MQTKIKTATFSGHTDATWGTIRMPTGVMPDNILFAYLTGAYSFYALSPRGDNQMLVWYINQSGVVVSLKDVDVTGVVVYR